MSRIQPVLRRIGIGLALVPVLGLPAATPAAECPSVSVRCALDITGKRYVDGQESSVRCRASGGHTALYDPSSGEFAGPAVLLTIEADDLDCDSIQTDMLRGLEPDEGLVVPRVERDGLGVFAGGSEQRANGKGKTQNDCAVAMTNVDIRSADQTSADTHGSLAGRFKLDELEPGTIGFTSGKAALAYRRRFVDGAVTFVGSIKLSDCVPVTIGPEE